MNETLEKALVEGEPKAPEVKPEAPKVRMPNRAERRARIFNVIARKLKRGQW